MSKAIIGILAVAGIFHLLLVIVPIMNTLRASISGKSKSGVHFFCCFHPLVSLFFSFVLDRACIKAKLMNLLRVI